MATNQVFDNADSVSLPVPAGTEPGVAVLVGGLKGVTRTKEGTGGNAAGKATVDLVGAYRLQVTGALKPGTPVYMAGSPDGDGLLAGSLTATSTSNTLFGHSLSTKGSGSGPATIRVARV